MYLHNLVTFWFSGWEFIAETNSVFVLLFTPASKKCFQMETLNSKLKTSPEKIGISCLTEIGNLGDSISLIIQGCSMVLYSIWPRNHTAHKKFYFNEFVANVLRDVIGIVIFDLHGGC